MCVYNYTLRTIDSNSFLCVNTSEVLGSHYQSLNYPSQVQYSLASIERKAVSVSSKVFVLPFFS